MAQIGLLKPFLQGQLSFFQFPNGGGPNDYCRPAKVFPFIKTSFSVRFFFQRAFFRKYPSFFPLFPAKTLSWGENTLRSIIPGLSPLWYVTANPRKCLSPPPLPLSTSHWLDHRIYTPHPATDWLSSVFDRSWLVP